MQRGGILGQGEDGRGRVRGRKKVWWHEKVWRAFHPYAQAYMLHLMEGGDESHLKIPQ